MPSLKGRSPKSAYAELLKVSNSGAGIDGTLRNIEDGSGNATGIQIGTGMVGIFGYQFPSTGFTAGQVLRINTANTAFEWHAPTASDLTGLAAIATSGSYTDLKNTPTIPTNVSQLANDSGFATTASMTATYGSGAFVLPTASASVLGGVKIGSGLTITTGTLAANVTSVAGRTGVVALAVADVSGAAPLANPVLTGSPTAPTAATGDASTKLANTQFVFNATQVPVSVALTGSAMTLTAAQYSNVSIIFTGALTQNITVTLPSAFGMWTIYNATTGSFTVTLTNGAGSTFVVDQTQSVELFSAGSVGVIPAGTLSTTPTAGDNSKRIATTSFVTSAITTATPTKTSQLTNDANFITASGAPVQSVAGRTGAVVLSTIDISGITNYALLASPALSGTPTTPTATAGTANTQIASTAFVSSAITTAVPTKTSQLTNDSSFITSGGAPVQSVAGRTGSVVLAVADITGAAPIASPTFTGTPATPTATAGTNTTQIASTAFVTSAITSATPTKVSQLTNDSGFITSVGAPVQSVAGRTGAVVLSTTDVSGINSYATLASPTFTGTPIVPTAIAGTNTTQIASTAFVNLAITTATPTKVSQLTNDSGFVTVATSPVTSVASRTGAIVLAVADINGAAPLASPTFTGTPIVPTATAGTNTTQIASTAFALAAANATVTTFNTRTGAVTLSSSDVTTALGFTPYNATNPSAYISANQTITVSGDATGSGSTAIAITLASVGTAGSYSKVTTDAKGRVTAGSAIGSSDVTTALGYTPVNPTALAAYAPLASPALTGSPTVPTATVGTSSTQIASTAFVANAVNGVTSVALAASNVTLTSAQYGTPIIIFTGTLTANVTVTFPASGLWTVINATTGAFTVTMTATTGGSIVIPSTYTAELVAISTGLNYANSIVPATSITSPNQAPVSMGWLAQVLAGMNTINVTGNTTLVASQTAYSILLFTGSLSSAATITLPLVPSGIGSTDTAILWNQSGSSLTFTVNTGGTITLANGESCSASLSNLYGIYLVDQISYTQSAGDNSHKIATTAFVASAISTYAAPVTSVAGRTGAITLAVADVTGAAPLASPTFTGTPTGPTPAQFDNSTKLATTAFVQSSGMQFNGFTLYNTATTLTAAQIGMAVQNYSSTANTFTLPTATSIATGRTFYIFNQGGSTLTINLAGGSDFLWSGIASLTSLVLNRAESVMIMSRGAGSTEYDIIGGSYANKFVVRQLVNTTTDDGVSALQVNGYATATSPLAYDDTTKLATTQWVHDTPYRRNKIINSRFDIWQRGISWTTPVTGTYTADKFRVDYTGTSAGAFTVGQALNNTQPNGITSSIGPNGLLAWNHTTAPNLTSLMLSTRCEDAQTFSGQQCTVSFNIALGAGSQTAFNLGVNLAQCYGTGGSPSATVTTATQSTTINSATFQRLSFTFTLPVASGTFGTNGNDYLAVQFILPTNQLFSFYIDHIQLEPGAVATPFMNVLIPQELAMCQRYYNKTFPTAVTPATGTLNYNSPLTANVPAVTFVQNIVWNFPVPMRATPATAFFSCAANANAYWTNTANGTAYTTAATLVRSANTSMSVSMPSGSTGSVIYVIHATADADL